jgi:tRNA pseudouridine32 synthase/23S rRNA pseudouridine746 synthase/23S rRNA pseudouridine1911/1915/1917 synthase
MKYVAPSDSTLLETLVHFFPQSSKTTLRSWIQEGRIAVDDQFVRTSHLLVRQNQVITVGQRKKFINERIPILYEDKEFVVIDKPAGLLSVSTNFEKKETAHALLKAYYHPRKIYVVHRLDQDTSGVLLFAFGEHSGEKLKNIFAAHAIERCYTAIVEGKMTTKSGTWKSYLSEDEGYRMHSSDDPSQGEEAITHYKTTAASNRNSWLTITLETGKKNQIRVHCKEAGHPVVGDKKYGAKSNTLKRLGLHAHLLAFEHPSTHKKMRFESPIPSEFYKLIQPE